MKALFLITSLAIGLFNLQKLNAAPEIIYQTEVESDTDFEAKKIARANVVGYDDYLANQNESSALKENLTTAFLLAQEHFLHSEISVIENDWRDVTAFALKADWAAPQREMIQIAYMRLAQLSTDVEETQKYILAALTFDNQFTPDSKLFPPPLVDQYSAMRTQVPVHQITFTKAKGFTYVLINGVKHKITNPSSLRLPTGQKRVTFLSATYAPVTRLLDTEVIGAYQPDKKLLANLNHKSVSLPQHLSPFQTVAQLAEPSIENKSPLAGNEKFYKKQKFWLSAALITGTVLVFKNLNQDKDKTETTHREGL